MNIDNINPDYKPDRIQGQPGMEGVKRAEESQEDKISSTAVLYEVLKQLAELGAAAKSGTVVDGIRTGENISQDLRNLVDSFQQNEVQKKPMEFFTKLLTTLVDANYLPKEHGASIFNQVRDALSPMLGTLDDKLNFSKGLVAAFQKMEHGDKGVSELASVVTQVLKENDPDLNRVQNAIFEYAKSEGGVFYTATSFDVTGLSRKLEGLSEVADILEQDGVAQGISPGPLNRDGSKIIEAISEFINSLDAEEFKDNPAAFFQKLLNALAEDNQIPRSDVKNDLVQEIKSLLAPAFRNQSTQSSLSLSLSEAYRQLTGGAKDVSELRDILNRVFGEKNPVIETALKEYSLAAAKRVEVSSLLKSQELFSEDATQNASWQDQYDALLKEIAKGRLPVDLLEAVYSNAPEGSEAEMKMLTKHLEPLLTDKGVQDAFANYLAMYTAQTGSEEAAENQAGALISLIQKYANPRFGEDFNTLRDKVAAAFIDRGGPFHSSDLMTPDEIKAELSEAKDTFNNVAKVPLRNKYILYNAPIMMALFVLLMSKDGAYGYLAKIMDNLNGTMEEIKKYTQELTDLNNDLNKFMTETDPEKQLELAKKIQESRNDIRKMLEDKPETFGEELRNKINDLVKDGGTLDDLAISSTGLTSWDELIAKSEASTESEAGSGATEGGKVQDEYLKKLQEYLTGTDGGAAGEGVTTTVSEISNLLSAVNTHNQAQLEKLNMVTKKIDALTKLFSAAITMNKGLIQTLTQYSGS